MSDKRNPFKAAQERGKQEQAAIVATQPEPIPEPDQERVRSDAAEKVGLNLRISKERRAFIKSWCALHNVAMNDLFSDVIDQIEAGRYNPLDA